MLTERGTSTTCPSEIARALEPEDWRPLMQPVRDAASELQRAGRVDAYQRGRPVNVDEARGPIRLRLHGVDAIDYRAHPEKYVVGRGEMGVLTVEPYKSELLPLWKFKTPALAKISSDALYAKFIRYRDAGDFVGMDMARKFLQMGWTRSRRYANHPSGRKYDARTHAKLPIGEIDAEKTKSAEIFKRVYDLVRADPVYVAAKKAHGRR